MNETTMLAFSDELEKIALNFGGVGKVLKKGITGVSKLVKGAPKRAPRGVALKMPSKFTRSAPKMTPRFAKEVPKMAPKAAPRAGKAMGTSAGRPSAIRGAGGQVPVQKPVSRSWSRDQLAGMTNAEQRAITGGRRAVAKAAPMPASVKGTPNWTIGRQGVVGGNITGPQFAAQSGRGLVPVGATPGAGAGISITPTTRAPWSRGMRRANANKWLREGKVTPAAAQEYLKFGSARIGSLLRHYFAG